MRSPQSSPGLPASRPRTRSLNPGLRRRLPPGFPLRRSAIARAVRSRLLMVWLVLVLGALALVIRLFVLQVVVAGQLAEMAEAQQMVSMSPFVPRYPIVDRNGDVLAMDQLVYTLYAHPTLFKRPPQEIAAELAPILNRPAGDLLSRFSEQDSGIRLADTLTEDEGDRVAGLGIDGLELIQGQHRLYPHTDLFANVVGFVNVDRVGQAGLEYSQDEILGRIGGAVNLRRAGDGSVLPGTLPDSLLEQNPQTLRLTLDSELQRASRMLLKNQMARFEAKQGAVIVMDVRDGAILSMVAEPSFNPNEYYRYKPEQLNNWPISGLYEPGSTFKPINVAIALEAGAVQPNDVFYDEGHIEIGGWPIENSDFEDYGGRGNLTVTDILKYSSNVGMIRIMQQLEPSTYYDWMKRLGLGEVTGVDLPFEAAGQFKSREQFTGASVEPATAAFGQGFSLTPLQLIQLHATLANGGKLVIPHVVQGLYSDDETQQWQPDRPAVRQVFSPQTTRTVLDMMEQIVKDGTGKAARIPGYRIAGKTGTAQKVSETGGYEDGAVITSFVSILPSDAPRYAILVVVDQPRSGDDVFGSTVAAPVSKAIMEVLIATEQLRPTEPVEAIAPVEETLMPDDEMMPDIDPELPPGEDVGVDPELNPELMPDDSVNSDLLPDASDESMDGVDPMALPDEGL